MKRALITLLSILSLTGQALAWDDICSVAGPIVNSTTVQVDSFADKNSQRTFEGSGKIKDVKNGGLASKVSVIIDCGNDVLLEVPSSSPKTTSGLQIGETINFSGKLNGVSRRRYVNTHTSYLLINFNDYSTVW
jgi:hypothetical protein